MTTSLRWGVLGVSRIARAQMAAALASAPRSRVSAVASRRAHAARGLADELGAEPYGSYAALLQSPDVDAVYVSVPNSLHVGLVAAALRAGKHVLCEKPIACDPRTVDELFSMAESADLHLMEGLMWRFQPRIDRARELVAKGAIGEIRIIRARYTFSFAAAVGAGLGPDDDHRLNSRLAGGAINDLAPYCVDAIHLFSQRDPGRVAAFARWGAEVEGSVVSVLELGSAALGELTVSFEAPGGGSIEIQGTSGMLRMPHPFRPPPGMEEAVIELVALDGTTQTERFAVADPYVAEVAHFVSVVYGESGPQISRRDSVTNARVLDALHRAIGDEAVPVSQPANVPTTPQKGQEHHGIRD